MITLVYWVTVAAIGTGAALVSFLAGMTYYQGLKKSHPELVRGYWPEIVRDVLLVLALAGNLTVGLLSINPAPSRSGMAIVAILGGATFLSLFAVFNLVLRIGR